MARGVAQSLELFRGQYPRPFGFPGEPVISPSYNPVGHPLVLHEDHEAAWDESVTVVVQHEVSLVPGPGRWLFQNAQWGLVPGGLASDWPSSGRLDRVPVVASSTMVLPGIQRCDR